MKYMGSKSRIAKNILPIILKNRKDNQYYIEPFVGGCNMIDKVSNPRMASDNNKYLIAMWKGLQDNLIRPREITKDYYSLVRTSYNNKDNQYSDFIIGWVGFSASFNGRFFDGGYSGKTKDRDYIKEQIKNIENQIPYIQGIEFYSGDYKTINYPPNSIIYCDPPYQNTKQYSTSKNFNYEEFWEWCRLMKLQGHQIFISEYQAPCDFICVWEKEVTNSMNTTLTYKPIEKLFTL
jgi:DNA adenine methylase